MMRRGSIVFAITVLALLFAGLAIDYTERESLRPLAESYVRLLPQQVATPNVITGILLAYRAFDTLGEVAVLFMVAAGVGLVLGGGVMRGGISAAADAEAVRPASELVQTGAKILCPLIMIFAAYIIMNGHISAGGGFQGGAVIASGITLLLLAQSEFRLDVNFLSITESLAGVLFVSIGVAGLFFASGFLDNRVLPLGQFGAFYSAGTIPILSVLLGVKVGCELCVIVDRFRR